MADPPDLIPDGDWKRIPGSVVAPKGFRATGMYAGMRSAKKGDVALVVCDGGATAAGTFTQNMVCAAPVKVCKDVLSRNNSEIKAVLVNAGQANAATGDAGMQDALAAQAGVADALGCAPHDVLIMSTGVIGRRIALQQLQAAVPALVDSLGTEEWDAARAAVAITTTDLVPKACAMEMDLDGTTVTLGGIAKGSGMIHPNMATMLAMLTCDAAVEPATWTEMVQRATKRSFNAITVDGDTSTNDTVLALASGAAGNAAISDAASPAGAKLERALTATLQGLAKSVAWDGEGATCLLEIKCTGARTEEDALMAAKAIAGSSLAKAAIYGHDPNWGRIACAAGYSGAHFNEQDLGIVVGPHTLMRDGQPVEFDKAEVSAYLEEQTSKHETVHIFIALGKGEHEGTAWGCDLSYDYVKINAEYTT